MAREKRREEREAKAGSPIFSIGQEKGVSEKKRGRNRLRLGSWLKGTGNGDWYEEEDRRRKWRP